MDFKPLRLNSSSLTCSICALAAIILQLVATECQKLHMVDSSIAYSLTRTLSAGYEHNQALAKAIQRYGNRCDARIVYSTTWWESLIFLNNFDEILHKLPLFNAFLPFFQNSEIHIGIHNAGFPKRVSIV